MKGTTELKVPARSVSRGVAVGKVVCLYGSNRQFYRIDIDEKFVDKEIRRFRAAARLASRQLRHLQATSSKRLGESLASIFDVQRLILSDESLQVKIETAIRERRVNAEWAVKLITDSYIDTYKAISDEHLRQRYIDIEDIRERLLAALGGGRRRSMRLDPGSVLVSSELSPSTLVELADSRPVAIATEHGGWTSHTFILARELNIPAVTGVKKLLRRVHSGDEIVVDGNRGELILRPSPSTISSYADSHLNLSRAIQATDLQADGNGYAGQLRTLDGREIIIRANADIPGLYQRAYEAGARGIGLYRSEYLFNRFRGLPDEAEQLAAYRKIAESARPHGVKIRTFDLSSDDLAEQAFIRQKNPALGLRAIRLSLSREQDFRTQLCALMQASAYGKIDIVLPMVSDVSEIRRSRGIFDEERSKLVARGILVGEMLLGAMIEVPAAVLLIREILAEVDFVSLGTNDLVQYILGVDRDNELVADSFRTLSPAVIRSIKTVIEEAEISGKAALICGEMAGSPFYAPLLVGLGATELSMNPASIARVRGILSDISYEEARSVADDALNCRTAAEAETALRQGLSRRWPHIFPGQAASA